MLSVRRLLHRPRVMPVTWQFPFLRVIATAVNLKRNLLLVIEQVFSPFVPPSSPLFTAYLITSNIHYFFTISFISFIADLTQSTLFLFRALHSTG